MAYTLQSRSPPLGVVLAFTCVTLNIRKEMIMGVIASRSSFGRAGIAKAYARLYGKDLREDLSERLGDGGGFNQVARDMFQPLSERGADYLRLAMKGTDGDGGDKIDKIDDSKKDNMLESAFRSGKK